MSNLNNSFVYNFDFPEIFITGELPENWTKELLIADGLMGWAICVCGEKPPENFDKGMVEIMKKVGTATPEGLQKLADKIINEDK